MKKIIFQDLDSLITSVTEISRFRMILSHSDAPHLMWRGPQGLLTHLHAILTFYDKYLAKEEVFEIVVIRIKNALTAIPAEESEKQILFIAQYKSTFFELVNASEEFQQLALQHFSLNALFQFTNTTFNSDILFSRIEEVFESESWNFIPETARADIIEGGKALLFNLPTSASFMFLRALEDCIRKICNSLTKEKKQLTFGAAIELLNKEKSKFDINETKFDRQITFLKYIKDEFRNPSAHPEKTFSQREAEQLFQVVNVAVAKLSYLHARIKKVI